MNKRTVVSVAVMLLAGAALAAAAPPVPLTLKDAIRMALEKSGRLAAARVEANVAQNQARVDHSAFLPNLATGTGAAYTYGFPSFPGGPPPSVFNLSYDQTLLDLPARGEVRADNDRTQAQRIAIDSARDQVIQQVATDYLELGEAQHALLLLRQERENAAKVLAITQQRVQAGLELPIDETQAELTQAKIEQRVVALEGQETVGEEELRTSLGLPENAPIEVTEAKLPPATDLPASQLLTLALAHSPELRQDEMERQAREAELHGQRGGYWPKVDLVAQYLVLSKINNYDQYYRTFQRNSLNVGLEVQVPIFRSRTSAAVALAASQYQQAQLAVDNRRRDLEIQVRQEAQNAREEDAARNVARLDLKYAQEKLQMTQAQYNQGQATLATLEQAQLAENQKMEAFLEALLNQQKAQLQLMRTTGQLTLLLQ